MGLADALAPQAEVRAAAQKLAAEIALAAPLAPSTRATMRAGLVDKVRAATTFELEKQTRLRKQSSTSRKASTPPTSAAAQFVDGRESVAEQPSRAELRASFSVGGASVCDTLSSAEQKRFSLLLAAT